MKNKTISTTGKNSQHESGMRHSWFLKTAWSMILLISVFMWQCKKEDPQDITKPTVTSTVSANSAVNISVNSASKAKFSEAMNAGSINSATFTLKHGTTPVTGVVTYADSVATFTPSAVLEYNTLYTATITNGVKDVAGNSMAVNYVWSFTTGAAPDVTKPTAVSTLPANSATGVAFNSKATATFSEALDPLTVNASTFTLKQGLTSVSGTVTFTGLTATFTPAANLAVNTVYTATVTTGVKDMSGNSMANNYEWNFKTLDIVPVQPVNSNIVPLAGASSFAILAGSGITNTGATTITGDMALSPGSSIGGFPPGILVGVQHINDVAANQAKIDLVTAYNDAAARVSTAIVTLSGNIGGLTLTPGLYFSTSTLAVSSGDLTLDAQGNANAVFIIQVASSFTTTSDRKIILSGSAKASNIFWQIGSSATFGTNSVLKGTFLVQQSITFNTGASLDGRAFATTGAVIMDNNQIVKQ